MTDQQPDSSDLNRIAIQEFRKLIEVDGILSEDWKKMVLDLVKEGSPPPSLVTLESVVKGAK